jgi:hypothetical protein
MNAAHFSIIVQSALSLIVLIFIVFVWWPNQRADLFRQQMFALRDELFDFALDGRIAFDDPAYKLLRSLMNGTIRYAHNLTPYRTLVSILRSKCTSNQPTNAWSVSWERALKGAEDTDTRNQLVMFHSRANMLILSQLVLSPGLLITILPFVTLGAMLYAPWATLRDIYVSVRDTIPMALLQEEAANS